MPDQEEPPAKPVGSFFLTSKEIITRDPRLHGDDRSFVFQFILAIIIGCDIVHFFSSHIIPELEFFKALAFKNSSSEIYPITISFSGFWLAPE